MKNLCNIIDNELFLIENETHDVLWNELRPNAEENEVFDVPWSVVYLGVEQVDEVWFLVWEKIQQDEEHMTLDS